MQLPYLFQFATITDINSLFTRYIAISAKVRLHTWKSPCHLEGKIVWFPRMFMFMFYSFLSSFLMKRLERSLSEMPNVNGHKDKESSFIV